MRKHITSILLFIYAVNSFGQLVTNSSISPSNLVQNTLLGGGINVTNITYSGDSHAIGFFDGSNSNIGLNSGIIMTTGTVENQTSLFGSQEGPFGPNDESGAGVDNNYLGDSQLETYAGTTTYNAAVLEFDFEATGNMISFNYVFASEEYPEYVNQGFNDAFAFWISGPGISGSQNIALIPGTNTPVTIDNINAGLNSSYFINNGDGFSAPQNNDPTVVQYDGFTTVLTASATIQCGGTYHIKLAIADVGDGVFDSGVFLEAQSFSSIPPMEATTQVNSNGNVTLNQLLEGCSDATISFTRHDSVNFNQTFGLSYTGTATNGVDYSTLPTSITFPPGQNSADLNITAINDAIPEGTENLTISLIYNSLCGQQDTLHVTLEIIDQPPLNLIMPDDGELSCLSGTTIDLVPIVSGGTPDYVYNWNTGEQTDIITVSPTSETTYILTLTDACGTQSVTDSTTISIAQFSTLTLTVSNDTTIFCPNSPVLLSATASGGAGSLNYLWNHNNETSQQIEIQSLTTNYFSVSVTDECNNRVEDSILVTVISSNLTTQTYGDTTICPYVNAVIGVTAQNGTPPYRYEWQTNETTSEITVSTGNTNYFYVDVYDSCNTYSVRDSVLVTVQKPRADFYTNPSFGIEKKPIYFGNLSENATHYYWNFGNGETSTNTNDQNTYENEGVYEVMLIAFDNLGCSDTLLRDFVVKPEYLAYIPNSFSPNNDGINDVFKGSFIGEKEVQMLIFDRWGKLIYNETGHRLTWDGTNNGKSCPTDVYIYKFKTVDFEGNSHEYIGHLNLIR